jgi:hypothetical protein
MTEKISATTQNTIAKIYDNTNKDAKTNKNDEQKTVMLFELKDIDNENLEEIIGKLIKKEKEVKDIDLAKQEQEINAKQAEFEEMKKFDRDNDGVISVTEQKAYEAYKEVKLKEQLKKDYDINNDGKIDEAEQAAIDAVVNAGKKATDYVDINIADKEAGLKKLKEDFEETKKFDINGDGKLDKKEQAARDAYYGTSEKPVEKEPEDKPLIPDFPFWKGIIDPGIIQENFLLK